MIMYSRVSFVLSAATFVTVFTLFFLIICTYKLIRKCIKDRNSEAESADHATSKVTGDSEFNSSVRVNDDGKGSTNEGFMVEIPPAYTAEMAETFPNAEQPNEEPPVIEPPGKELPNTNFDSSQTEKEMIEIGSTRFTSDGSMNTRF